MRNYGQLPVGASSLILEDGRRLFYAEFGLLTGNPVLYFHGCPGSCLEARPLHLAALVSKLRIIGIDRPGIGMSTFKRGGSLTRWCDDIGQLLSKLHIDEFSMIGFSAGAPYALRCLSVFRRRVNALALVSPYIALSNAQNLKRSRALIKVNVVAFTFRNLTALFYLPLWLVRRRLHSNKPGSRASLIQQLPEVDKHTFREPDRRQLFYENLERAFMQSARNVARDLGICATPLESTELCLASLKKRVRLWFGDADENISKETRHCVIKLVTSDQLKIKGFAGHCLLPDIANEVCEYLAIQ